ncbi:enoyl-CoA delta isomerase 3, peroxisomal [Xylocopa sonorina]|uniref:enoyl-CoA delta isomerase 3, peroxisomal n=1 Tax=Xylocopa sonorina TaxID=1818115 RepID=UPI00403A7D0E
MMNKHSGNILYSVNNGILKIVLNQPKKKNAITNLMYKELTEILHKSIQDSTIHMTVVTGAKDFFSSGNDFTFDPEYMSDYGKPLDNFKNFMSALITYPKLLVAIVNGPAIGIAMTILPLFDMVYASERAYFHTPFTWLGIVTEGCSSYTFPKVFGKSKAGDILYLGYKMDALEAKQYGLVSKVYKHEHLHEVWSYLQKVTTLSSESILAIKRLTKKWDQDILLQVTAEETVELLKCMQSPEFLKRLSNVFLHKSKI